MKNLNAKQLKEYYLLKQKMDYIKQLKESNKIRKEIENDRQGKKDNSTISK
jgi:hypothetical protein